MEWGGYSKTDLYQTINRLHHEQEALWNGSYGAQPVFIGVDSDNALAWTRSKGKSEVAVAVNFGDKAVSISMRHEGNPLEKFDQWQSVWGNVAASDEVKIAAHSASVCVKSN